MKASHSFPWSRPSLGATLLTLAAAAVLTACGTSADRPSPISDAGGGDVCTPDSCAVQNLHCDPESGLCVECLAKADCADECQDCVEHTCREITGCGVQCPNDGIVGEDGACLTRQEVDCAPVPAEALPEHAASVSAKVTITWTAEDGWTSPETCGWRCLDGFTQNEEGTGCTPIQPVSCTADDQCTDMGCDTAIGQCALVKTVPCDSTGIAEHAVVETPTVQVTWNAESGRWDDAPACEWSKCEADWHVMDEAVQKVCVYNTANMECAGRESLPAHAVIDNPHVTVLWNEAENAWNAIPECNWVACEVGYYKDGAQCSKGDQNVECAGRDSVPAHTLILNPTVSIYYIDEAAGWSTPETCQWKCIEGWHIEGNACVTNESYSLPCTGTVPENGVVTNPYIPQTWNETRETWEPGTQGCKFACKKEFHFLPASGVCESDIRVVNCADGESLPEHAIKDNPQVTIRYENNTWPAPEACTWSRCEEGWHAESGICASDVKEVACNDAAPDHATSVSVQVPVTWNTLEERWNAPANCAWRCDPNYHKVGEACAGDEQDVDCLGGIPTNATASNATIHQTYGDNGWQPAAEACDWKCNANFHTEDGLSCASNTTTRPCNDAAPAHATSVSVQVPVTWNTLEERWNAPANCAWRCDPNYHKVGEACAGDEQDVDCLGGIPTNATASNATIHQTYGDNGWQPAAESCDWECDANFHTEDGATCDPNTRLTDCIDAAPDHAKSVSAQVSVQWNKEQNAWETAQNCIWNCDDGYHPEGDACIWTCASGLVNDTNDGCIDCRTTADCNAATEYCEDNECRLWCGNGTADNGEACDWNDASFDTSCPAWHSGAKSCSRSCTVVDSCIAPSVTCRSAPRNVTLGLNGSVTVETHFSVTAGDKVWTDASWDPAHSPLTDIRLMVRAAGGGQWQALSGTYGAPTSDGADANSLRVTYAVTADDHLSDGTYDAIWGFTMDGQEYWCPMDTATQSAPVTDKESAPAFISLNVSSDHCDNHSDCASGICEPNGACATQKVVSCAAVTSGIPANGHANPSADVTIYFDGSAWDPIPSCGWSCDDGFHLDGGTCTSDHRTVDCTGRDSLPAHAVITNAAIDQTWNGSAWTPSDIACTWNGCEADWHVENDDCVSNTRSVRCSDRHPANSDPVLADVTITWTEGAGWSTPADCQWHCVDGFHRIQNTCVSNSQEVLCADHHPAHSTPDLINVTVTWNEDANAWNPTPDCEWHCNANYHRVGDSCAGDEQNVPCTGTTPEHATASNATIHQTYGDDGWQPPVEACRWTCDGGFHTEDDRTCVSDSQEVACHDAAPQNAVSTNALVTITWTEGAGWSTPADCQWDCVNDYHRVGDSCVSDDDTAPCHPAAPENAHSINANVPIHWTGTEWSAPADCEWECDDGFHKENTTTCISNTRQEQCADHHPPHSTPNVVLVTVTWTEGSGWSDPEDCQWDCVENYHRVGDSCAGNERDVPCVGTTPDHATSSNANIHQTYGDDGWQPPAEACHWTCDDGFHKVENTCVSDDDTAPCHPAAPENAHSINTNVPIHWTGTEWSTPADCEWECNDGYYKQNNACVAYCGDGQINNNEECDYNGGNPIYADGACPAFYPDNRQCDTSCKLTGGCEAPDQWCKIVGGTDEAGLTIGRDDGIKDTSYAQFYIKGLTDQGHAPAAEQFQAELFVKIGQGGEDGWVKLGSSFNKIADTNNAEMKTDVSFELLRNAGVEPDYLIENSPFDYVWRYQFGQEEKWHYCTKAGSQHNQTPTDVSEVNPDGKLSVDFCIVNQCGTGEFEGKYCEPTNNDGRGEWIGCASGLCYDVPNGKPSCLECNATTGCAADEHCIVKENPLDNYCESNTQTAACNNSIPANSHYNNPGTFQQTWNEDAQAWEPATSSCGWSCNSGHYQQGNTCVAYCGDGILNNGEQCDYNGGNPIYADGACPAFYSDNRHCSNTCQFSGSCEAPSQWCRIVGGTDASGLKIGLDDGVQDTSYTQFYIQGLTDQLQGAPAEDVFKAELYVKVDSDEWFQLDGEFNKIENAKVEMMSTVTAARLMEKGAEAGILIDNSPHAYVWRYQFGDEDKWHYCTKTDSQNNQTPTNLSEINPNTTLTVNYCMNRQCGVGEFENQFCNPDGNNGRGEWIGCEEGKLCYNVSDINAVCVKCLTDNDCPNNFHCLTYANPADNWCESNTQTSPCTCTKPDHAHCTETTFTQTWTEGQWLPSSHQCAWDCDDNYTKSGSTCVANTRPQNCSNTKPEHSHYADPGTFTQTWNGNTQAWEPATSSCEWVCDDDYHKEGNSCVSNTRTTQYCTCPWSDIPEHGYCNQVKFPQTWNGSEWTPASQTCSWSCEDGFLQNGNECQGCRDYVAEQGDNWHSYDEEEVGKANSDGRDFCQGLNGEFGACDFENNRCAPCTESYGCEDGLVCAVNAEDPMLNMCVPCTATAGCREGDVCEIVDANDPTQNVCRPSCRDYVLGAHPELDEILQQLARGEEVNPDLLDELNLLGMDGCAEAGSNFELCDLATGRCMTNCTPTFGCDDDMACVVSQTDYSLNECQDSCLAWLQEFHESNVYEILNSGNPDAISELYEQYGRSVCEEMGKEGVCDIEGSGACVPCTENYGCEAGAQHCNVSSWSPLWNECIDNWCHDDGECEGANPETPYCNVETGYCGRCPADSETHWDFYEWECVENEREIACNNSKPDNSSYLDSGTFAQTWNGTSWEPEVSSCKWECNSGYHQSGNFCVSNTRTQNCNNKPAHSYYTGITTFTQTWNGSAWEPATSSCPWKCNTNYYQSGSSCIYNGGGGGGDDGCAEAGEKAVDMGSDIWSMPQEYVLYAEAHEAANKWCFEKDAEFPICHVDVEKGTSQCVACDELYPACMNGYKCEIQPDAPEENKCVESCRLATLGEAVSVYNQKPAIVAEANALGQKWCAENDKGGVCDFDSGECVPCTATAGCEFENGDYCAIDPFSPQKNKCDHEYENCYWTTLKKYPKLEEYGFWWNNYEEPVTQFTDIIRELEEQGISTSCKDGYCDYPTGQCFTCTETEGCGGDGYCIYTDDTHQDRTCSRVPEETACSLDGRLLWDGKEWTTCLGRCGPKFDKPEEYECGQSCSAFAWNNSYIPYDSFYDVFGVILAGGDADGWGRLTHLYSMGNAYCQKVLPEGSEATVCDMFTGQCVPPPSGKE